MKCMNSDKSIVVIRDPFERFKSLFLYWKYGNRRSKITMNSNRTVDDFIFVIKNYTHAWSRKDFWYVHTKPQFY